PGTPNGTITVSSGTGTATSASSFTVTATPYPYYQQGGKLVGTGATGAAKQGTSVAISADGNTAVLGGPTDNMGAGAVWVFTRNGTTWSQQGSKLTGSGAVGAAQQGTSASVSANGNTIAVGGLGDNSFAGATWIFTRNGTAWSQQGGSCRKISMAAYRLCDLFSSFQVAPGTYKQGR
ncbi:MAG: hypothetical protein ACKOCH_08845, partial [Bacteroidota bacterium]